MNCSGLSLINATRVDRELCAITCSVLSFVVCVLVKARVEAAGEESDRAGQRRVQMPGGQRRRQLERQSNTTERHTRCTP